MEPQEPQRHEPPPPTLGDQNLIEQVKNLVGARQLMDALRFFESLRAGQGVRQAEAPSPPTPSSQAEATAPEPAELEPEPEPALQPLEQIPESTPAPHTVGDNLTLTAERMSAVRTDYEAVRSKVPAAAAAASGTKPAPLASRFRLPNWRFPEWAKFKLPDDPTLRQRALIEFGSGLVSILTLGAHVDAIGSAREFITALRAGLGTAHSTLLGGKYGEELGLQRYAAEQAAATQALLTNLARGVGESDDAWQSRVQDNHDEVKARIQTEIGVICRANGRFARYEGVVAKYEQSARKCGWQWPGRVVKGLANIFRHPTTTIKQTGSAIWEAGKTVAPALWRALRQGPEAIRAFWNLPDEAGKKQLLKSLVYIGVPLIGVAISPLCPAAAPAAFSAMFGAGTVERVKRIKAIYAEDARLKDEPKATTITADQKQRLAQLLEVLNRAGVDRSKIEELETFYQRLLNDPTAELTESDKALLAQVNGRVKQAGRTGMVAGLLAGAGLYAAAYELQHLREHPASQPSHQQTTQPTQEVSGTPRPAAAQSPHLTTSPSAAAPAQQPPAPSVSPHASGSPSAPPAGGESQPAETASPHSSSDETHNLGKVPSARESTSLWQGPLTTRQQHLISQLHSLPPSKELAAGDNPWWVAQDILHRIDPHRHWTDAEILRVDAAICRASGVSVPEWNIPGHLDDHALPVGFKLTVDQSVQNVIREILHLPPATHATAPLHPLAHHIVVPPIIATGQGGLRAA